MPQERIRDYIIEGLIGAGGMAMVYLAKHENLHRLAAIKVLLENLSINPQIRDRFIQEARFMASLNHPNIVTLYEFTVEPKLSLIMEYVDGNPLDKMIGEEVGPIPWEKALPLFIQILDGIGYAHSKNIVHRDIKPANILISKEGTVKITDLGIAKIAGQHGMTRTGTQMGTLYYESPEQIKGAKDVDYRSDIYSLGMTLYEMLAGRLPFETEGNTSEFALMNSVVNRADNLDPREYYPHIPEWLVKTIQKATDLNPEKRFQSCEHFKQIIEKYGKLSESENTFWSEKVALIKTIPIQPLKSVSNITQQRLSSKGMNCPNCTEPVEKEMEFCGECGANLTQKCPACSEKIRWNRKFCPKCGTNIEDYLIKQAEDNKQKEVQEECKRKETEVRKNKEFEEQEHKRKEAEVRKERDLEEQRCGHKEAEAENKRLQQARLSEQEKQRLLRKGNIITDNTTGLEWLVGSDKDIDWNEAKAWVDSLGENWRLPTLNELQGMYSAGITSIDWGSFQNTGSFVWSIQTKFIFSAWNFCFDDGLEYYTDRTDGSNSRAFAVRSN